MNQQEQQEIIVENAETVEAKNDLVYDEITNLQNEIDQLHEQVATLTDYINTEIQTEIPIFLALGKYDYTLPETWWDAYHGEIPTLTIYRFEKSGHYPHVEEQTLFDNALLGWMKQN